MIFSRTKTAEQRPAPRAVPDGTRVYAVGDIHGRADLLAALHERIREDAAASDAGRKLVVYLGDYVDRGAESKQVIDLLLDRPLEGFEAVHLKGNHEAFMLDFLSDPLVAQVWIANGGGATLASYGVEYGHLMGRPLGMEEIDDLRQALTEALPERHRAFLDNLALHHREGDYLFVHAGIRPGVPVERQDEEDLVWIRDEFLDSAADHGFVVVHGHTIEWDPVVRSNRIGIDTGAFASGTLTALVLEGEERDFLHTLG